MIKNKEEFIKRSIDTLTEILGTLEQLPAIKFDDLSAKNTVLVMVDMVNGFAREGALMSSRVEGLIPALAGLSRECDQRGIAKIAFADSHTKDSPEFEAYPVHCMMNSNEGEIVDELKEIGGYQLIPKNSTNGFLEEAFRAWLMENEDKSNFIVTGDCTDICVQQFAITLKTYFNRQNKKIRVIVPMNLVDTYDFGLHNGDLTHVMALYNMIINGVEVVAGVE